MPTGRGPLCAATAAVSALVALCLTMGAIAANPHVVYSPGAAGIGDPYFPLAGNGGYDVQRYRLEVRYDPATDRLVGRARITAVATQDLSSFNLDLVGLTVSSLTVHGRPARWIREQRRELVVTPPLGIRKGKRFEVDVRYAGWPRVFHTAGSSIPTGGVRTDDGVDLWGEPEVAAAWFPVNDHPRDKATYRIELTVPAGLQAISNGRLISHSSAGQGWERWTWEERVPMASYLALASIGRYEIRAWTTSSGLPMLDAVDPRVGRVADAALAREEEILDFLSARFGPYPFEAGGAVVDHHTLWSALENQTRPLYDWRFFGFPGDETAVVHELAHQWFGDSVSVDKWKEIWLNEGFATYAEWLWSDQEGLGGPQEISDFLCTLPRADPLWYGKPGAPTRRALFDPPVYYRGAMTLQALRTAVGDDDFFAILRGWAAERRNSTGTTAQFVALAERTSNRSLDDLFVGWLYTAGKPAGCASAASVSVARVGRSPVFRRFDSWFAPAGLLK